VIAVRRALPTLFLVCLLGFPRSAAAQRVPIDEYIRYVPLEVPRAVRQSPPTAAFPLYVPPAGAPVRDVDPLDGLDDGREAFLLDLGARFAPVMVQNSHSLPMDPAAFRGDAIGRYLHIDNWNVGAPAARLVERDSVDLLASPGSGDESRLRRLFEDYHPDRPASARERATAIAPGVDTFRVLYLDFPGGDAASWRKAYEDPKTHALRAEYRDRVAVQVHPFIVAVDGGYELVLQYWFFYPFNDGGNNHLGDWEHLNVLVQRRSSVTKPWDEAGLRAFLANGRVDVDGPDALVIRRLDYYFHSKVFTLDYSAPNAYLPRPEWTAEVNRRRHDELARDRIYDRIRWRAWADDAETVENTHPIVHIGADNKGTDQLLSSPGGSNRDSHGSYPFAGLFRDIGPAAAAEGVPKRFDHHAYFALAPDARRERYETFGRGGAFAIGRDRLRLLPDFEPVLSAMEQDSRVLSRWFPLVVPVRYGYPCVQSPLAGVVAHAETGNLAVVGASFNGGWNTIGAQGGFGAYEARALPGYFPSAWQDQFDNSLGWLNITYPSLSVLPPFSLLWWGAAAPARALLQDQPPHFYPHEEVPARFVGGEVAYTAHEIDDDFLDLLYNRDQFRDVLGAWLGYLVANGYDSTTTMVSDRVISEAAVSPSYEIDFHVGRRFVSENRLRHSRSTIGEDITYSNIAPVILRAELNMWEYSGSLRYNFGDGRVVPHARAGYGLSWYRLEKTSVNGMPLATPDSPWIRKPTLSPMTNLLPNTLHVGAGVEWFVRRSRTPSLPAGFDLVLRADGALFFHDLGLNYENIPLEDLIQLGFRASTLPHARRISRGAFSLGLVLSF